jgi:hypothetical protein
MLFLLVGTITSCVKPQPLARVDRDTLVLLGLKSTVKTIKASGYLLQGRAGVLKKTTNEQRLMGPSRSERWLNINIFPKIVGGGMKEANFFRIYQNLSAHIVTFPGMQKFSGHIVNFTEILNFFGHIVTFRSNIRKFFRNIFVNFDFCNITVIS